MEKKLTKKLWRKNYKYLVCCTTGILESRAWIHLGIILSIWDLVDSVGQEVKLAPHQILNGDFGDTSSMSAGPGAQLSNVQGPTGVSKTNAETDFQCVSFYCGQISRGSLGRSRSRNSCHR